ncbi:glycosyltransferase family 61 protein [Pinibacter soli]|uniref:Glycosyltransferase family 61 protein n=1 Tax=Pinibacter soli TaxID=3044211 RepID=A0ABT6R9P9_9BACT|nr:glycosyltransferase family 61 protein [Pinibacter soli]MDI3318629.1 glycosyltransferase family 61 protein [Pinibacter soli]
MEQSIRNLELSPIYYPNQRHLNIGEIAKLFSQPLPAQRIKKYTNALITSTNHLFVGGRYIQTGIASLMDDRKLSLFNKIYLYAKSRFFVTCEFHNYDAIWAHTVWSDNYYHWLAETLPRLFILANSHPEAFIILPNELKQFGFIKESIELLKLQVNWIDQTKSNRFKSVSIVENEGLRGDINPLLQQQLRERLFQSLNISQAAPATRKIYISRSKARYRKLVNEEEIVKILLDYKYEIIYTEGLSIGEQIKLFSETRSLIAIHGAGHTNCMFMKKGGRIMEIRNKDLKSCPMCFFSLANIFDLRWEYCEADAINEVSNFNDVYIDPKKFKIEIEKFETEVN